MSAATTNIGWNRARSRQRTRVHWALVDKTVAHTLRKNSLKVPSARGTKFPLYYGLVPRTHIIVRRFCHPVLNSLYGRVAVDSVTGDLYISIMEVPEPQATLAGEGIILKFHRAEDALQRLHEKPGKIRSPPVTFSTSLRIPLRDVIFVHPACMSHCQDLLALVDGKTSCFQLIDFHEGTVHVYQNEQLRGVRILCVTIHPPVEGKCLPEFHIGTVNSTWVLSPQSADYLSSETAIMIWQKERSIPDGADWIYSSGEHKIVSNPAYLEVNGTRYFQESTIASLAVINLRIWRPGLQNDIDVLVFCKKECESASFMLWFTKVPENCSCEPQEPLRKVPRNCRLITSEATSLPKLEIHPFLNEKFQRVLDLRFDDHKLYLLCYSELFIIRPP
ncbi:hypothetical protein Pelo_9852 [Pelomyxa schiedti]|nr:hypothetical protein Pelo_9852 [Pelomyxa schiedti]